MEDKTQSFRQPLVTATGIILGFILNFAATWVKTESPLPDSYAYFVAICILLGVGCLITTLYRLLRFDYPREKGEIYYGFSLKIFIVGLVLSFIGVLTDMFVNFMVD